MRMTTRKNDGTGRDVAALLHATAQGSQGDFRQLVDAISPKLFGVLLTMLRDKEVARDALQETFVRVWTRAHSFDATLGNAEAWLVQIARNHAIDLLRQRKRRGDFQPEPDVELIDYAPTSERRLTIQQDVAKLMRCLAALESKRGDAIRLAYLKGKSYAELADHFDIPVNTVRTWLRRGLLALKECVDG